MTHGVMKAYSGYLMDNDKLVKSASGGFAYAFSLKHIQQGGVVYSVRYSPDFRTGEWDKADTVEKLSAFQGSKYVESRKAYEGFNLYEMIRNDLDSGSYVLAIGLPCDIGAIKAYLKKDYVNLTCVDLVCHGPVVKTVAEEYLDELEKKYGSRIVDFTVRYKKNSKWTPPYLRAVFENGKVYMKPFYKTDYGIAFSIMSRLSCYNCQFKSSNHKSDITIGDYWGLAPDNKKEWNDKGVSIAFVRTSKGEELINSIRNICVVNETDAEFAMAHNVLMNIKKEKNPLYDKFVCDFRKYGLHAAVVRRYSFTHKCILLVRRILSRIVPQSAKKFIKKHILHRG